MSQSAPSITPLSSTHRRTERPLRETIGDYWALTKPSINRMCLLMTAGGLALAPQGVSPWVWVWTILGTAMSVGAANALNMWWERESDRFMKRTQDRPLAQRRISEKGALAFGLILGAVSLVVLAAGTNGATAAIGAFALISYVVVYTPLKYRTPLALVVGAVPGAAPPLMGWTATTGTIDAAGLALFATLFVWQIPHFIAIAMFRKHDYVSAGIKVVTAVRGNYNAKLQAIAWAVLLIPVSIALTPLGVTGWLYATVAAISGAVFLGYAIAGLRTDKDARWARRFFILSLLYLPTIVAGLVLDLALI